MNNKTDQLNKRRRLQPRIYDFCYFWCSSHIKTLQSMVHLVYLENKRPTVLDIGCGDKPLQKLFPQAEYIGVDINPDSAADIILDCNQDRLPMDDNSVDAIIISNALEHICNTQNVIQEVRRVLRQNGLLYFSVPMTYPVHAHPHDYIRFTRYYFQRTFADWQPIELNVTNSIFSTPSLLGGQILATFLPDWIIFPAIILNNICALLIDYTTKSLFGRFNSILLKQTWESCPIELNGIYKNIS